MPGSLFLKIFLWFWVAMSLVGGALVISGAVSGPERALPPAPEFLEDWLLKYSGEIRGVLEGEGPAGLDDLLDRLERREGVRAWVFDGTGERLSGGSGRPGLEELVRRCRESGGLELSRIRGSFLVAQSVEVPPDRYIVAAEGPFPSRRFRLRTTPQSLLLRLLAALLTAGLVCYALARYLASPVTGLQEAVRRFSKGDLTARVGDRFAGRGDEFSDLAGEFDRMAERIQHLVQAQKRLLSDISHELRSPLARLRVALELARRRDSAGGGELDRIEREAERMNEMIGQLLELARLEDAGKIPEAKGAGEEFRLDEVLGEVVEDARFEADAQGKEVSLVSVEECRLAGYPDLMRSALENVIRNGVRYTAQAGAVEVELARTAGGEGSGEAAVRIRDQGPGVPEEALQELFRPFYRVGDARDRQSGGTGLGLAIADRIVRLHGGAIEARNLPGRGLEVEIRLPCLQGP